MADGLSFIHATRDVHESGALDRLRFKNFTLALVDPLGYPLSWIIANQLGKFTGGSSNLGRFLTAYISYHKQRRDLKFSTRVIFSLTLIL